MFIGWPSTKIVQRILICPKTCQRGSRGLVNITIAYMYRKLLKTGVDLYEECQNYELYGSQGQK